MQEKWFTYLILITGIPVLLHQTLHYTIEDWPAGIVGTGLSNVWRFYVTTSGVALGGLFLFLLVAGGIGAGLDRLRRRQRENIIATGEYTLSKRQKKALRARGTFPVSLSMGKTEVVSPRYRQTAG